MLRVKEVDKEKKMIFETIFSPKVLIPYFSHSDYVKNCIQTRVHAHTIDKNILLSSKMLLITAVVNFTCQIA